MQFADPSLSHPSRCSRARWPTKCQKQGWASRPEFRVLSLGLPADTRLLGKTVQTEIFQQRGGAVKALTPRARPFCNLQVGELRECANRGRNTWFPAPRSPSSLTYGPHPTAPPTGCRSRGTRSALNGRSLPQWLPREHNWGYPHPPLPRPTSPSRASRVRPPLVRSWCFPSRSGDNREHNWDPHPRPDTTRPPPLTARGSPRPHAQFQERLSDLFHLLPPDETQGQVNPPHRDNPSCL